LNIIYGNGLPVVVDMVVGLSKKGLLIITLSLYRGGAIQFFGTKRHHDKWLTDTENYVIKGCFAMSELGHGSNVCEGCLISLGHRPCSCHLLHSFLSFH
jgi:alkylation response protein AidB-like acyl-CoA dehydrogenase